MKKNGLKFALVIALAVLSLTANATLILKENFNYAVGDSLCGQPSWDWMMVPAARNTITIQSNALTYTGYPESGTGNKISLAASGEDLYTIFPKVTSGGVYTSFLVNVKSAPLESASAYGDYICGFVPNPVDKTIYHGRVYIKRDASNKVAFGILRNSTGTNGANITFSPYQYDLNTTYLIVVKYQINTGGTNDVCTMVVNPIVDKNTEPTTWLTPIGTDPTGAESIGMVGGFGLRQGSSAATCDLSSIRIANSWSDLMDETAVVSTSGIQITTDDASQIGFQATATKASAIQKFKISATDLVADLVITEVVNSSLYNFEMSTDGVNFTNNITLTPTAGTIPLTTVYVRMKAAASGPKNNVYNFVVGATTIRSMKCTGSVVSDIVPDAPTAAVGTKGNAQVSVAFTAPVSNAGPIITGYTVTSLPEGIAASGTASPIVVTGLTNGTAYTFTVVATNVVGNSVASSASAEVIPVAPATAPNAPTAVEGTVGDTQISVAFTAPAINGGSAITGYTVTSSPGGLTATGTESPIVVTGLTNGTAYTFTVVATNIVGSSLASAPSAEVTPSEATALNEINANFKVASINGTLKVSGVSAGQTLEVYNSLGLRLISVITVAGENKININSKGLLIVKIGKLVNKVVL